MRDFLLKWGHFLSIIFSPDVIISVVMASVFGYWSITAEDEITKAVSAVVMAILAGLAGARLSKLIIEESRKGQIFTRGQSAVRGLGLIFSNLGTLEAQLEKAQAGCKDSRLEKDFIYIKNFTVSVQRQTLNSIEEWKDILPEADIRRIIDDLRDSATAADELRVALEVVQEEVRKAQNDAGNRQNKLETLTQKMENLEIELKAKEGELKDKERKLQNSVFSPSLLTVPSIESVPSAIANSDLFGIVNVNSKSLSPTSGSEIIIGDGNGIFDLKNPDN